jgi:hypothetical protein
VGRKSLEMVLTYFKILPHIYPESEEAMKEAQSK